MERRERTPTATLAWVATALGCGLLALSTVLVLTAVARGSDADVDERLGAFELVSVRSSIERAALDVVVARLLADLDVDDGRPDRLSSGVAALDVAVAELDALAFERGPTGVEARQLLDAIDVDALEEPATGDLVELFEVADDARYWAIAPRNDPRVAAFDELSFVAALPSHILLEAIAGIVDVTGVEVPESVEPLMVMLTDVVRTEGGWLAADPPTALDESIWFGLDRAREQLPTATSRVEEAFGESALVELDGWARDLGEGMDPPPIGLAAAAVATDSLSAAVIPVIEASEDASRDALVAESADDGDAALRLALAAALAAVGVALSALGIRDIRRVGRVARERAALATLDALTGVGNRHRLDDIERLLGTEPNLIHHVVAIVDLDRFKLVNDLHGHAAGDAVLVDAARRLDAVAQTAADRTVGAEHAVIRLGGDEFMLAFHSNGPIDVESIRADLERDRNGVTSFDGVEIPYSFSVGLAMTTGVCDIDDLMRAADLAVYEAKADRGGAKPGPDDLLRARDVDASA